MPHQLDIQKMGVLVCHMWLQKIGFISEHQPFAAIYAKKKEYKLPTQTLYNLRGETPLEKKSLVLGNLLSNAQCLQTYLQ